MPELILPLNDNATIQFAAAAGTGNSKPYNFINLHIARYKIQLLTVILIVFVNSCTNFLLTLILGDFFILQLHTHSSKGKLLKQLGIEITDIHFFFLVFFSLLLLKFFTGFAAKFLSMRQGELFVKNIREKLFAAQISHSAAFFSRKPFGNYLLRYSNDMKAIQGLLTMGVLGLINEIIFLATGLLLMTLISPELGVVVALLSGILFFLVKKLAALQKKMISKSRDRRSNLLGFVAKAFARFNKIKADGTTDKFNSRFIAKSGSLFTANIQNGKAESLLQSLAGFIPFFVIGIILLLVSGKLIAISASDGLSAILILILLQGTFRRLLKIPGYINKGKISLDKINEVMMAPDAG